MALINLSRIALPFFATFFVFIVIVFPLIRMKRRTGVWAITAGRNPSRAERGLGLLLLAGALTLVTWSVVYAIAGPIGPGFWKLPDWVTLTGWACLLFGTILVPIAQHQMGASWRIGIDSEQRTDLVTHGLFSISRNPIYLGMFFVLTGATLVCPALATIAGAAAGWISLVFQTRREEQHMLSLHGEIFEQYAAKTGRFLPGIGRLSTR